MDQEKNGPVARKEAATGLFGDARARLLTELCSRPQTAAELARRVETSANAVRVHLEGLRSAGLVDYRVERRGVGKPRHVYAITSTAETFLSAAYAMTLRALIKHLQQKLDGGFSRLLRDVGTSMNENGKTKTRKGLPAASRALELLGAQVFVKRVDDASELRTHCCPLAAITRDTPAMCGLVEEFLSSSSGMRVKEMCVRGEHPRCHFVVRSVA